LENKGLNGAMYQTGQLMLVKGDLFFRLMVVTACEGVLLWEGAPRVDGGEGKRAGGWDEGKRGTAG
jgi:hypothetical protein